MARNADLLGRMEERNEVTSPYCGGGLADSLGRVGERNEFTSLYCGVGLADLLVMMERNKLLLYTLARLIDLFCMMEERNEFT